MNICLINTKEDLFEHKNHEKFVWIKAENHILAFNKRRASMDFIREILFCFFAYGYMGWLLECVYASAKEKKWIRRRGVFTQYFLPLYGTCGVIIMILFNNMTEKWLAMLVAGVAITFLEYVVGWQLHRSKGLRLWDYSGLWGNIKGYICLPFTCIWCVLALGVGVIVQPFLMAIQGQLSSDGQWLVIGLAIIGSIGDGLVMHKQYIEIQ